MSAYLWKAYLEDDFETFRQLLATGVPIGKHGIGAVIAPAPSTGSPARTMLSVSPTARSKVKPGSRPSLGKGRASANNPLSRAEVNSRDAHGVTLLHTAASSQAENAEMYVSALLQNHLVDLYIQDLESGWTALHRALYAGNISIAQALIDKDMEEFANSGGGTHAGGLIKIKDREGNSPFDVYSATVAARAIPNEGAEFLVEGGTEDDEDQELGQGDIAIASHKSGAARDPESIGDEFFMFGSNKNLTLGFGDEDDRHFPERVTIKRPQVLIDKFFEDHDGKYPRHSLTDGERDPENDLPASIKFKPVQIRNIQLAKLSTAILTTDPQANLYMCGFGPGGRLGTGDQVTRFQFCSILGGGLDTKKIAAVGLGQDHTIVVTSEGEVFTWGSNKYGQLGYGVPVASKDEEPMQLVPKQLIGPLRRETFLGCSASRTHSVIFTSDALFTFGKNDGQLGLVDADARSIEKQTTPRKVAASILANGIKMACAIDKATVFLLENHEVWVFANYGYAKMSFPLNNPASFIRSSFSAVSRHDGPNHIIKICGAGDTICGLARTGEIFTTCVSQKIEGADPAAPKIRGVLSPPQRIWSLKKDHMAVQDVDVGQDGSVIICTKAGSVWKRVKRAKVKDSNAVAGATEHKAKDYKFTRIPGLTHISAVRSNAFGAFSAARSDSEVLKTQVQSAPSSLWDDVLPLLSFGDIQRTARLNELDKKVNDSSNSVTTVDHIRQALLASKDIEHDLRDVLRRRGESFGYDIHIGTTLSDVRIPAHLFLLMARSSRLRDMLILLQDSSLTAEKDILSLDFEDGIAILTFKEMDILTVINFVFYLYTDNVLAVWNLGRQSSNNSARHRKVRVEVMKLATELALPELERAARLMTDPARTLNKNFDNALKDPRFFDTGDLEVELEDADMRIHSALACQRCPFFDGLFHGRAGGSWLDARLQGSSKEDKLISIDLQHVTKASFVIFIRFLYSDAEEQLFAHCATADLDDFLDIVLDVLAIANELMMDRLAQVCQRVLGRYVTTRNVCWLLNAVAPCSVTRFKVAALEYICMNLEGMLENRLLDELDDDLFMELSDAVKANQLAYMPFARSGRAEAEIYELYPELLEQAAKEKQTKVDYMVLQSHLQEDEVRMAKLSKSPALKPKSSTGDFMFSMDEDGSDLGIHRSRNLTHQPPSITTKSTDRMPVSTPNSVGHDELWYDAKGKAIGADSFKVELSPAASSRSKQITESRSPTASRTPPHTSPRDSSAPWASTPFQSTKLDMKEIMDQAGGPRKSSLASGLFPKSPGSGEKSIAFAKLSQKERKKAIQAQKLAVADSTTGDNASTTLSKSSPWRTPSGGPIVSLKDELTTPVAAGDAEGTKRMSPNPSLTMRQTIPGKAGSTSRPDPGAASPRSSRRPSAKPGPSTKSRDGLSEPGPSSLNSTPSRSIPQSIRHIQPSSTVTPLSQLSMADILAQQQTEKDVIKEATARRSLQEIQQEQAFQEWWNQEEAATKARMEQEAAAQRGRGGRRSRGGNSSRGKGRSRKADDESQSRSRGGGALSSVKAASHAGQPSSSKKR